MVTFISLKNSNTMTKDLTQEALYIQEMAKYNKILKSSSEAESIFDAVEVTLIRRK